MELQGGYYASPRWTYEILDCSMPMTFDTYSNCSFQCVYCFSFFQRAVGKGADDYLHHQVQSVNVDKVKRLFKGEIPNSQFNWYIKRRMVLQWGGLSDGFDYYEKKFGHSLDLLNFWNAMDYPLSISTKGVWFIDDPRYLEAFKDRKNLHIKTSIITLDEHKAAKIERGAATPEQRFKMLEWMNKIGVAATTVRFRPFILGVSADYPFTLNSRIQLDDYVHRTKEAGCYSLTTEFLTLERRASNTARERFEILGRISGIPNLLQFYAANSYSGGLMRLNYDLKRPYFEALEEICDKYGIKYFVSDAHHKEKSYHAGCCGLPEDGPLSNTNRGQFAEAILIAKREGKVRWSDIQGAAEALHNIPFGQQKPEGFNMASTQFKAQRLYQDMYDYMRDMWNNPKSLMSPARYFGGALVPDVPDENGDLVYLYNAPYILDGTRVGSVQELKQLNLGATETIPLSVAAPVQSNVEWQTYQDGIAEAQADGNMYGLVAYKVTINAVALPFEVTQRWLDAFKAARITPHVYADGTSSNWISNVYPDLEVSLVKNFAATNDRIAELAQQEFTFLGEEQIWFIRPTVEAPGDIRALLSDLEGRWTETHIDPTDGTNIRLLQCAQHEPQL